MIREFNSRRLILGKLVVTWDGHTVSEAHPFIDPAWIICDTIDRKTGEDLEHWTAGGYQIRCSFRRTDRRTRAIAIGWRTLAVPKTRQMRRMARERQQARLNTVGTRSSTDAEQARSRT